MLGYELEYCEQESVDRTSRAEDWERDGLEDWRADRESALCSSPSRSTPVTNNRETAPLPKLPNRPTRRQLAMAAAATLSVGLLGVAFWDRTYLADAVFGADLMRPGPLGEEALGEEQALHTVIEYASLTCPHCARFIAETFPALKVNYIDTGRVRFILREFPFDRLGLAAAVLARNAEQGSYFAFVEALLRQQDRWRFGEPIEPLFAIAAQFGFTRKQFSAALTDQYVIDGVDWVRRRAAEKFNVSVTPTFFIDGKMYKGNMSIEQMGSLIE
jgi:protein-disulfide isomerase